MIAMDDDCCLETRSIVTTKSIDFIANALILHSGLIPQDGPACPHFFPFPNEVLVTMPSVIPDDGPIMYQIKKEEGGYSMVRRAEEVNPISQFDPQFYEKPLSDLGYKDEKKLDKLILYNSRVDDDD